MAVVDDGISPTPVSGSLIARRCRW
jgi:hypothetical protein